VTPKRFRQARGEFFLFTNSRFNVGNDVQKIHPNRERGSPIIYIQSMTIAAMGGTGLGQNSLPRPLHGVGFGQPNPVTVNPPHDSPRGMGRFVVPPRRTSRFAQPLKSCDSFPLFVAPVGPLIGCHKAARSKGFMVGLRQERRRRWRPWNGLSFKIMRDDVATSHSIQPIFFSEN
jgi:hypothetical protein